MKTGILVGTSFLIGLIGFWVFNQRTDQTEAALIGQGNAIVDIVIPLSFSDNAATGSKIFQSVCSVCHGENAVGKEGFGPPLVHKIYEPSHHADESFQLAVQRGVRSHHWPFGDMPAVEGLTRSDVEMITAYIRELQRANGIN